VAWQACGKTRRGAWRGGATVHTAVSGPEWPTRAIARWRLESPGFTHGEVQGNGRQLQETGKRGPQAVALPELAQRAFHGAEVGLEGA